MAKPLHIMPSAGRWEVVREDEFDVLADFADREEAVEWAVEQAGGDAAVVVHREDFTVERSLS